MPERCQIYFEDDTGGTSGHYLDASTLDTWLDQIVCKRITLLIDMCRTQDFIESAPGLTEEPNRIIIGASGDIDNIAHAWYQARYQHPTDGSHFAGSWFFNPFWDRINSLDSVQEAYQYALVASDDMAEVKSYKYQFPVLIDKLRDTIDYSLVPYGGSIITFLNGAGDRTEINNLNISGGTNCKGITAENKYIDMTEALVNDNSNSYSDVTAAADALDSSYFNIFPTTQTASVDSFMVGGAEIFSRLYIELSTSGSSDGSYVVECSVDRDEWVKVSIDEDTTNDLTQSGEIIFKPPLEWAYQCHIHPVSDEKSEYTYWVRLRLIDTYTNIPYGNYLDLSYFSEGARNITNNSIMNNEYGIYLKGFSDQLTSRGPILDCQVFGNELNLNNYGIFLESCENSLIYHNNFVDNNYINQVYDASPNLNDWYNIDLSEGNYWSDYTGSDTNYDGIGDTSIPHPSANFDYYPFMNKYGWES
jgi:parallel beta-helix repeat protein